MATESIRRLAVTSTVDFSAPNNPRDEKNTVADQDAFTTAAHDFHESTSYAERSDDGEVFRQHIDKDGKQALVIWSKQEEVRVVRKADLLFLPLFSVGNNRSSQDVNPSV